MNKFLKQCIAISLFCLSFSHTLYAIEESRISSFMQTNIDRATTILRDKQLQKNEKSEKIFLIFDSIFDYSLMAQLSLGNKQWSSLESLKQNEFSQLFEQKLKVSYMNKLDLYTDEKIVIKNLEKIKDTRIHLTTHLMKNSEVYEIIYKFYKNKNDDWLIYDVDILGVSIIQTYRTQFADILNKEPFEKLLDKLKQPDEIAPQKQ
ncbi:ABC transporter substrate-binding protein [Sulfurospirillum barnesii]|uniref:ABC-type transport system involved in resistance to organic solvents, auxiliary component n=1 Tax=Sulfurospirillum barnesii (strain ATCC 700032 / DSM 10660 / SES-3) TaxID=760154 RepID=I3XUZ3_SULBS|nr:ABC transporter substrate-binding protein [Sulfurospirillum barnesii]AFL67767.1 ABC-type transport system involved in resistance to organic solvents, auxiliary component [Sulfurospirillum barnesii SES-3]